MVDILTFDINNISQNFDDFADAKKTIESFLIASKKLEKRTDLITFINNLNMKSSVFVCDEADIMPYASFYIGNTIYIIYCGTQNKDKNESYVELLKKTVSGLLDGSLELHVEDMASMMEREIFHPDYPYMIKNERQICSIQEK